MVNLETKELIFSCEDLPQEPQYPQEPTEIEKLKAEQKQQNEDILMNMLATTEMYELNKAYSISTLGVKTDKKVPTYIQATYQKLYELGVKDINEIPFEVRINLKAK